MAPDRQREGNHGPDHHDCDSCEVDKLSNRLNDLTKFHACLTSGAPAANLRRHPGNGQGTVASVTDGGRRSLL
ncbi:hypothetical protein GCM10007170_24600 [Arthrobacter liuii]|uniref:Uncharacterized protein n=1 Tax=Arthrobacter liuii TaxID=1476996 RepID=A0ABQ2AV93_9MICC|nr:hypothetical protein GCM10007170_24600 [Arthrobacter liuii]